MDEETKVKFNKIRLTCQAFYRVSLILWEDYRTDTTIEKAMPIVVNTAFACELAFKTLLVKCGQGLHKGHNLYNLFSELKPEAQGCILSALKLFYPSQTDDWLVDRIKIISNIYQKARYFHEVTIAIDLTFCRNFMESLIYIEQKLCGLVMVKDASDEIKADANELDSKINDAMSVMLAEAEESPTRQTNKVKNKK